MDDFKELPQGNEAETAAAEETPSPEEKKPREPKKVKLSSVIIVCLVVCYLLSLAGVFCVRAGYLRIGKEKAPDGVDYTRLLEIHALLEHYYVGELDEETMLNNALAVYTASVGDPYTQYMPKTEAEGYINGAYQSQTGIGVRASYSDAPVGIYISYVFPGAPAEKAGLKKGDVITSVDGKTVTEENYIEIVDTIAGKEGTIVTLKLIRNGKETTVSVTRGNFTVESVEYFMLETAEDIGYIRIDGVASNTADEFKSAVLTLKERGAKKYVFDVRDDGGGYLNVITSILDMLLPEGPIVRWKTADGKENANNSDAKQIVNAPFAVLINGHTASAAELFAAALRDYKLAVLVGEKTYGKGVMQTLFPLKNGDTIKITTAYYYPPYGDNYNGIGVAPDVEVALPKGEEYFTVSEEEDTQLQAAIKALNDAYVQD